MINSFKKTAFVFVFCSLLVTPQPTVCLDVGNISIGENAKLGLICAGGAALASLLGYAIYKFREGPPSDSQEKNRKRDGVCSRIIKNAGTLLGCVGGVALVSLLGCAIYWAFKPLSDIQEIDKSQDFICQSKQFKKGLLNRYQDYINGSKSFCELKQNTDSLYSFTSDLSCNIRSIHSMREAIKSKKDHLKRRKIRLEQKINKTGTCTDEKNVYMKQYDSLCDQLSKQKNKLKPLLVSLRVLKRKVESSPEYRGEAATILVNKVGGLKRQIDRLELGSILIQSRLSFLESKMSNTKS